MELHLIWIIEVVLQVDALSLPCSIVVVDGQRYINVFLFKYLVPSIPDDVMALIFSVHLLVLNVWCTYTHEIV